MLTGHNGANAHTDSQNLARFRVGVGNLLLENQRAATLCHALGSLGVGLRQYQYELFTAVAGKEVA